ncbi:hypothetical protein E2C01_046879 [Portunus trituberculatus]|uniref:Uncharacterized protein n=1 Tax=Portunus trituberculatus TaxID=210409 RepID=A0A5B7G673_PORTR|nr:hypothetical protein [Portunus trituberculatus]
MTFPTHPPHPTPHLVPVSCPSVPLFQAISAQVLISSPHLYFPACPDFPRHSKATNVFPLTL